MEVTVKPLDRSGHLALARMRAKLWPESPASHHLAELKWQVRSGKFRAWMAWDEKKPVGFAEAWLRDFANGCDRMPVVFLEGIWVEAGCRRQGTGRRLVAEVEKWSRKLGINEVGSDSLIENKASYRWHLKMGFVAKETTINYAKKLN
jgi:aminoglycoside 6'-N-acetyltransferase I